MSDKPSYLGLLNAIANGESQAHCYLTAWIETTDDPDVKCVLSAVAAREGEHGMSFAKRINELGYDVIEKKDEGFDKRMTIARSKRSDREKMEKLGFARLDTGGKPDIFDKMFTDHTIDIQTGALLGRYIAEERDSGRLLSGCYQQLCAREGKSASTASTADDDRLASLETKVDAICAAIEDLRATVVKTKSNGNGARRRVKAS